MSENKEFESVWSNLYNVPFHVGYVDAGGVSTRYLEAGNPAAPALILLHGTGGSWETFCRNIAEHSEHFHVLAIDMVGNGFSGKPDVDYEIPLYAEHLRNFMDVMDIERASFIGVSLGAWVAVRFAIMFPERTDKLVLLAASGLIANRATMERIRNQRSTAAATPTWESVKAIFRNLLHDESTLLDDIVAVRLACYRLPEAQTAMKHILCLQDYETRVRNLLTEDEWKSIEAPVLLIGGVDHDDDYLKTARHVHTLLPNSSYREMRNVNHWGHFEDPATFNPMSIAFLTQ